MSRWTMATAARRGLLLTAVGVLSAAVLPRIPGVETFKGQSCHTHNWPKEPVSFEGKRVAVIGTGATGIQTITEVAKTAAHLTVFQRTAQWSAPLHNSKVTPEEMRKIREDYHDIFARCQETIGCFIHAADPRSVFEVTERNGRRSGKSFMASQASASGWAISGMSWWIARPTS